MKALLRWLVLVAIAALALQIFFAARIALMRWVDPQSTTFERSEAFELARNSRLRWSQSWRNESRISDQLKRAVIASEDGDFVNHSGVEWDALQKAWEKNARAQAQETKRLQASRNGAGVVDDLARTEVQVGIEHDRAGRRNLDLRPEPIAREAATILARDGKVANEIGKRPRRRIRKEIGQSGRRGVEMHSPVGVPGDPGVGTGLRNLIEIEAAERVERQRRSPCDRAVRGEIDHIPAQQRRPERDPSADIAGNLAEGRCENERLGVLHRHGDEAVSRLAGRNIDQRATGNIDLRRIARHADHHANQQSLRWRT